MRLIVSKDNVIVGYMLVGNLTSGIEYNGNIPDDFTKNFKPSFYLLKNNEIVENPDYTEPEINIPTGPSNTDKQLSAMSYQQMMDGQKITDLEALNIKTEAQNAQMAFQIMMLGGKA